MIIADINELERITDMLVSVSSETDEVLNRLRKISAEIHSDFDLQTYPQYSVVTESVSLGIDALNRGNDTLQSLKNVLLHVATEYGENEKKHKNAIARMTARLSDVCVNLSSTILSKDAVSIERDSQTDRHAEVVSLVSDSAVEMQMVNIAAIAKITDEEYGIVEVETAEGEL